MNNPEKAGKTEALLDAVFADWALVVMVAFVAQILGLPAVEKSPGGLLCPALLVVIIFAGLFALTHRDGVKNEQV